MAQVELRAPSVSKLRSGCSALQLRLPVLSTCDTDPPASWDVEIARGGTDDWSALQRHCPLLSVTVCYCLLLSAQAEVGSIAGLMLDELRQRCDENGVKLETKEGLTRALVAAGFSPVYGARPLRRAVQRLCEDSVAEAMLGESSHGHTRSALLSLPNASVCPIKRVRGSHITRCAR